MQSLNENYFFHPYLGVSGFCDNFLSVFHYFQWFSELKLTYYYSKISFSFCKTLNPSNKGWDNDIYISKYQSVSSQFWCKCHTHFDKSIKKEIATTTHVNRYWSWSLSCPFKTHNSIIQTYWREKYFKEKCTRKVSVIAIWGVFKKRLDVILRDMV